MKKILFFDDETFVSRYLVRNMQDNYGWNGDKIITYVSSVDDLLDEIYNEKVTYNLFILDIMTSIDSDETKKRFSRDELELLRSGMNTGLIIAKRVREIGRYNSVPILFLSARTIPRIPDEERKITAHIRKPVSPEEITSKMKELMGLTS